MSPRVLQRVRQKMLLGPIVRDGLRNLELAASIPYLIARGSDPQFWALKSEVDDVAR